jgi:predicted metal-dependent hydrolase
MVFTTQFICILIAVFIGSCIGAKIWRCDKLTAQVEDLQQRIVQIKTAANVEHFTRLSEKEELLKHLTLATNSIVKDTAVHKHCVEIIYKYGGVAYGRSVASEESLENNS